MNIGIIGIGHVGSVLGRRWAENGHRVVFGARDPSGEKAASVVARAGAGASAATVAEAASSAELVVIATPFDATEEAIAAAGDLTGKVVIDCTCPLAPKLSGLTVGTTDSAAEAVARWAPGARIVKSLNCTGTANMADPRYKEGALVMFVCGDDADAKAVATEVVAELGFEVVDAGPLESARWLEPLAMLWISLAYKWGQGQDVGFRLVRR